MLRKQLVSRFITIVIIIIVSAGVYVNTLDNDFVHDDRYQVLKNEWIKNVSNIPDILFSNAWSFMDKSIQVNYYRPIMHFIYMIDYHLFGLQPWGFHLTNIFFHSMNSIMVFLITLVLLDYQLSAFIAALFFATHPINTEAVAWIAGIPELSFALFYLISFYFYVTHSPKNSKRYILSLLFFFLAAISKETALTLPILIFVYDYACRKDYLNSRHDYINRYLPFLIIIGIYILLRTYALGGIAPQQPRHAYLTGFQYLINIFPLIVGYFKKLLLPINFNAFYVLHPVYSILEPETLISFLLTIIFFIVLFVIKRTNALAFFSLTWIFIPLLPILYIRGVGENTFAERYLYLPSIGFAILVAITLKSINRLTILNSKFAMFLSYAFFGMIIIFYSLVTTERNTIWKDDYRLWTDTVKKSPDSSIVHYNLGVIYSEKNLLDMAIAEFTEAIKIRPNYTDAHFNLARMYGEKGLFDQAIMEYKIVLRLNPENDAAHNNLGVLYAKKLLFDQAISEFEEALRIKPDSREAKNNLTWVLNRR